MSRSRQTVGVPIHGTITVYDAGGPVALPVNGLTSASFTVLVSKNGVDQPAVAATIVITFISSGRYDYTFTPPSVGYWHILIRVATYNTRGGQDEFDAS